MNYTPKLTDQMVMDEACDVLSKHLPLQAAGYVCTSTDLWHILVGISVKQTTFNAMCESLADAPCGATVRGYLNEQLTVDRLDEIQKQMMETIKDLQNNNITPETRQRQEKILSRMLDFQLATREKDFEQTENPTLKPFYCND